MEIESSIGDAAVRLANDVKANCIVSLERVFEDEIRSQRDNGEDGRNKYHKIKPV